MDSAKKDDRRVQIETAAYGLLALKGYKATSMLEVAKRAKASNETLYKWYGNKQGLFLSMVERNTGTARETLEASAESAQNISDVLDKFGPELLNMVTGQRAVVLARAAAGDVHDTGKLGQTLFEVGRGAIAPLLTEVFAKHGSGNLAPAEATDIYLDLLLGDLQIRRVIGVLPLLKDEELASRAERAKTLLIRLMG